MRQAELNNWSLEPTQIADLCSSINQFFARTGVIQPQGPVQPPVCHGPMHPNKPSQHLNTGPTPSHPGSLRYTSMVLLCWPPTSPNCFCCVPHTGNLYIDSRQGMSMMGPPGYPHMPPMNTTGPTMTGNAVNSIINTKTSIDIQHILFWHLVVLPVMCCV